MSIVFERPHALLDVTTNYCPGCTHGIIHKLVAQVIAGRSNQEVALEAGINPGLLYQMFYEMPG